MDECRGSSSGRGQLIRKEPQMPADSTQRDVTPGNQTPRPYCSAACWFALERVQVPTEYVPPADVQIAWPDELAAKQSKIAIATGTGLILSTRGLSCWP